MSVFKSRPGMIQRTGRSRIRVWVITSLAKQDIQQCLGKRLHGDAVQVGWPDYPIEKVEVPPGMRPLGVWWD